MARAPQRSSVRQFVAAVVGLALLSVCLFLLLPREGAAVLPDAAEHKPGSAPAKQHSDDAPAQIDSPVPPPFDPQPESLAPENPAEPKAGTALDVAPSVPEPKPEGDRSKGLIVIDLAEFQPVSKVSVLVAPIGDNAGVARHVDENSASALTDFTTPGLVPGLYRVVVRQSFASLAVRKYPNATSMAEGRKGISRKEAHFAPLWRTEVEVQAGMVHRLRAVSAPAAGARVMVLGPDGGALHPAVITLVSDYPYSWGAFEDENEPDGWDLLGPRPYGFSNTQGVATVYGMPAATTELMIQAPGYERQNVPILLRAGELNDLGVIYLKRAPGVLNIYIEREDGNLDAQYELWLYASSAVRARPVQRFKGNHLRLDGLELLRYDVAIRVPAGDVGADSQVIQLDSSRPKGELTFKMRSLK